MLYRFERLMEQAIEGSLRRVFPTSLQPIQLAKAAARAMEQAQIVGVRVSLAAVSENGDGFSLQRRRIGVVLVKNGGHGSFKLLRQVVPTGRSVFTSILFSGPT